MSAETSHIRLRIQNHGLRKQLEHVIGRFKQLELQKETDTGPTDLLILELSPDVDADFKLVQQVAGNGSAREIFLASGNPDQAILLKAIRAGAREFFGPNAEDAEIQAALERFMDRRKGVDDAGRKNRGRIITVSGSKGGVGTTTVAVNLAVSLANQKQPTSVVLLDMNLFGDIPLFMEIEPAYTWSEIIKNISRLDSTFLKNILAVDPSGVQVLPSPGYMESQYLATPEVIQHLLDVLIQMFDFIIVDVGQVMNDNTLKFMEKSDMLFLVSVQSLPCLATTNKLLRSFRDLGYPEQNKIHIILNRYMKKTSITLEDVERSLGQKVFWTVPNDYATTISAINKGQPLAKFAAKEEITKSFKQLAESLSPAEGDKAAKKKSWWLF
ncbi:AAA family ATPase [Desulfonatronum lacustre]|uniref:AAA family ATPase n=1 Tax=Desulfonatronum lacustre TaxID=66849 RepID=UPI0004B9FF9B|nr:AAA family ATPase [Desulfonatronum lacustre]